MTVGLPDGPPLAKFKKGQEAEAQAWAECVPGWNISFNGRSGRYAVDFIPHNMAKPQHHPDFYNLDDATGYAREKNPDAAISVS